MGSFFAWYLLITLIGLIAFPLVNRMFEKFADGGYGFSKIAGLLGVSYIHWILVTLGAYTNTLGGVYLSVILFAGVVFVITNLWPKGDTWENSWVKIRTFVVANQRVVGASELLFFAAFAFWAFMRALNPEVSGTEKPMELAFINSIIKSAVFPPSDPWLSGYAISYYYFGYVMAGILALATKTPGSVAFNLMLAMVTAMAVAGSYSLVFNLLRNGEHTAGKKISMAALSLPVIGPMLLTFMGNAEGFLELLRAYGVGWRASSGWFWSWLNIKDINVPPDMINVWPPRYWFWWRASRVLQDYDLLGNFHEVIDEFPFFSFLLGDLHPHVLAIPFVLLSIAVALALLWRENGTPTPLADPLLWGSAVVLGGLAFLNTWDFPIYFGLVILARLFHSAKYGGWSKALFWELALWSLLAGTLSILLYLPFYLGFSSQAGGLLPNIIFPTRGAYIWVMFLPLLVPIFWFGGIKIWRLKNSVIEGVLGTLFLITALAILSTLLGWVASSLPEGAALINSQGYATFSQILEAALGRRLAYLGGLVTVGGVLSVGLAVVSQFARVRIDRKTLFVFMLVVVGAVLVLVPEFVYLRDQFGNRMNTVFKFYYQAWILWSIAAGYGMIKSIEKSRGYLKWIPGLVFVLTCAIGLVYPITSLPEKTGLLNFQSKPAITLDGASQLAANNPDEYAAILWLRHQPQRVIVEAIGGSYSEYARMSTFSGQPTLLGWPGHESQWRGGYDEVGSRQQDVEAIYVTPDWQATKELLEGYNVDYVVIGNLERVTYKVFEQKFAENLAVAYQTGSVTIYQYSQ